MEKERREEKPVIVSENFLSLLLSTFMGVASYPRELRLIARHERPWVTRATRRY